MDKERAKSFMYTPEEDKKYLFKVKSDEYPEEFVLASDSLEAKFKYYTRFHCASEIKVNLVYNFIY